MALVIRRGGDGHCGMGRRKNCRFVPSCDGRRWRFIGLLEEWPGCHFGDSPHHHSFLLSPQPKQLNSAPGIPRAASRPR